MQQWYRCYTGPEPWTTFHIPVLQVRNLGTMIVIWKVGTRVLTAGDLHIKKGPYIYTKDLLPFPPYLFYIRTKTR